MVVVGLDENNYQAARLLVREYMKSIDKVEDTDQMMDWFGEVLRRDFTLLLCLEGNEPVGYLLSCIVSDYKGSYMHVEQVYSQCRAATKLLYDTIISLAQAVGVDRFCWVTLTYNARAAKRMARIFDESVKLTELGTLVSADVSSHVQILDNRS